MLIFPLPNVGRFFFFLDLAEDTGNFFSGWNVFPTTSLAHGFLPMEFRLWFETR